MSRSIRGRLSALLGAVLLLAGGAAACTPKPAAGPAKANFSFNALTLKSPGAGINYFENASLIYPASNVPKDGKIVMQLATLTGTSLAWKTVLSLPRQPLGHGVLTRPPFGRDTYRISVLDHSGKVLASTAHNVDVYEQLSLGLLASRPVQYTPVGSSSDKFRYYFQAIIEFPHTSCRTLNNMEIYNKDIVSRLFTITQTLPNGQNKVQNEIINPGTLSYFGTNPIQPGSDLTLHVADNDTLGQHVYVQGNAVCFTDDGNY